MATAFQIPFVTANVNGETHHVPVSAEHRPAAQAILSGNYYEPNTHRYVHEYLAQRPGTMIHAGAFFGDMIPSFSHAVGEHHRLVVFEPVLENYVLAKLTIAANKLDNVFLQNSAFHDGFDLLQIKTREANGTSCGGGSMISAQGNELVTAVPIDSLNINDLSILHLDVECHELPALAGGVETIRRCKPMIMLEDYNKTCDPWLEAMGYRLQQSDPYISCWEFTQ